MKQTVLIIDDDPDFTRLLAKHLSAKGASVLTAGTAKEGFDSIKAKDPDVVLLDVNLPDKSGVELVSDIKGLSEEIPIVMVSGYGDTEIVVAAMKAGASDYIKKPLDHAALWEKIVKLTEMRRERSTEREIGELGMILGTSAQTKQLIREISKVANSDAPVLLRGESGTGKSMIAEAIHEHSPRKERPFVTINCPAIPENLLESELFGHEKGAFTGAIRDKKGKFELADCGTIFLDEIGDLPPELQVKILRVLQNHEFERVGGLKTMRVDVRIIAATSRNLEEAIATHKFREDLFYRLSVLPIYIMPLRERKEDIPVLTEHFLKYFGRKSSKVFDDIPKQILDRLVEYDWPGNIRELQNVIERAVVLGRPPVLRQTDFVIVCAAPAATKPSEGEEPDVTSLKDMEYRALMKALEQAGGNISRAAKILGIGRDTIYRRLKKYNIGLKKNG